MNNEDLVLKMILDESGFTAGMNSAVRKLGDFDGEVSRSSDKGGRSLGNIWTSFVGNFLASGAMKIVSSGIGMITSSIDGAINRVDTLNNANRVFENMGFSAGETKQTMDSLKESINGLPTPLDSAIKGVQLIASSTNDLSKSEEIFSALNNGILGFGGSAEMVDNAIIQLSQSFSNGKVDAQTWNSMINSGLGPALNALAKQAGMTTGQLKEGLSSGEISVASFQDALINLNKNGGGGLKSLEKIAQDSTAGIKTGIANMKTAIVRGVANIITKFDEGLKAAGFDSISETIAKFGSNFEGVLTNVANAIPGLLKGAKELYDTLEPYAPLFVGLIAGLTTFTVALKVNNAVNTVADAFKKWKAATEGATIAQKILNSTLLANPLIAILTAVVALTAGLIYLWNTNEDFRNSVISAWNDVKEAVGNALDSISKWGKETWDSMKKWASDSIDSVKNAWTGTKEWFSNLWEGIKEAPGKASDYVNDKWSNTKSFFTSIWENVKASSESIWGTITENFSIYAEKILAPFKPIITWFSGLWEQVKTIFVSAWEIIKTVTMGPILLLVDLITGEFDQLKADATMLWETLTTNITSIVVTLKETIFGYVQAISDTVTNIWTIMKDTALGIWLEFKNFFVQLWIDVKYSAIQAWTDFQYSVISLWNNIVFGAKQIWLDLKYFFVNLWIDIKFGAMDAWDNLKNTTIQTWGTIKQATIDAWNGIKTFFSDTVNSIVESGKNAWNTLTASVSELINNVTNTFDTLKNIDLMEAGKAIIESFTKGLKQKWEDTKNFVGGIGEWIREHKGPISYDRKLLVPAGQAIMDGLKSGLATGFEQVKTTVKSMADDLNDEFGGSIDAPSFDVEGTKKVDILNQDSDTRKKINPTNTDQQKGDTFNIHLQAMGELSEVQLMKMAKKIVYAIEEVRSNDNASQGGIFNGI